MKTLIITWVCLMTTLGLPACDICSCSSGANYFGLLPAFQKSFIGIRYNYLSARSKHLDLLEANSYDFDTYQQYQFWGRLVVKQRLHLYAFLPYKITEQKNENETTQLHGIGDLSLIANIMLIKPKSKICTHALLIGGGIKIPTGKYNQLHDGLMIHQNLQNGTGSYDFPANLIYTLRYKKIGINLELGYVHNQKNLIAFRYGDKQTALLNCFRWIQKRSLSIMPQMGAAFEQTKPDYSLGEAVDYTGAYSTWTNLGIDFYLQKISLNARVQIPFWQQINHGYTNNNIRISTNLIYLF